MIFASEALQHSLRVRQKLANTESIRVTQAIDAAMTKGRTDVVVPEVELAAIEPVQTELKAKGYNVRIEDDYHLFISWGNANG